MNINMKKVLTGVCCILSSVLIAAPGQNAPAVRVKKVTTVKGSDGRVYVGKIHGDETVDIEARVSGTLLAVQFAEGSIVKKGQTLFVIENTLYKAALDSSRARLAQSKAELLRLKAEYDFALTNLKRQSSLRKQNAVAESVYDEAVRMEAAAKAALQSAEASVTAAEAALLEAETNFSYTVIKSPVDGKIGRNVYSAGNYITPAKGVMATVVKFHPAKITFAMSEADFYRFSKNGTLDGDIELRRADGKPHAGKAKVAFTDNQVDPRTGTLMVELSVDNENMELLPGGFVTVRFQEKFGKGMPAVPIAAVMTDREGRFVYCLSAGNMVERRAVVTGAITSNGTEQIILSGVTPGETIVVGGMQKIRQPGMVVMPVESK